MNCRVLNLKAIEDFCRLLDLKWISTVCKRPIIKLRQGKGWRGFRAFYKTEKYSKLRTVFMYSVVVGERATKCDVFHSMARYLCLWSEVKS